MDQHNTRLKVAAVLHIMAGSVLLDLQVIFNKLICLFYRGLDIIAALASIDV